MSKQRLAIICINEKCRAIYGCTTGNKKTYCRVCDKKFECKIICVNDVSGGLCASCYELKKLQKRGEDV